ncbi:phosphopyruvate hydratase [Rickettsiales bacterium]|nr:phosphopyruvate hydratase [Rickettsiales bacterium]
MAKIESIIAREILDSRGNPTLEADVILEDGTIGRAAVPSGASTGSLEAFELRDGDQNRYLGKGVLKAKKNVNDIISKELIGESVFNQNRLDNIMLQIDGTKNKSNLGANAILAVSLAVAKAGANALKIPLFEYIAKNIINNQSADLMPIPMMNILNGGEHADNKIDIQEFMVMPIAAESISDAIRIGAEIFHNLKKILKDSGHNTNVGDEGGFAPNLDSAEEALEFISKSIKVSGYEVGKDVVFALDAASTEFYENGNYDLKGEGKILNSDQLIKYYQNLCDKYPIISIEDAMAEDDFDGWKKITEILGDKITLVGDDLFVTNKEILQKGIDQKMANAILVKVNQIGTLSETLETIKLAQENNYKTIISHRSGETEDNTISHIAIATNAGQIKTGSLCRSDRTAKYNELIRIEEFL